MQRSHVTRSASCAAGAPELRRLVGMLAEPGDPAAARRLAGARTSPVAPVGHDLERPAGVGRRQDGLLGEERLVGHHPEVLVDRRVVDGEAASRRARRARPRRRGRRSRRGRSARARARAPRAAARSGPSPHDDAERRVERGRLEQQVDPLRAVEPAHGEDEVAVAVAPVGQLLRRVRHHLGREPGRALEPLRRRCATWRRGASPHRARCGRGAGPSAAAPGPRLIRRTGRDRFGRARTPAGTGAAPRRASRGAGRNTTGNFVATTTSIGRPSLSSRSSRRQRNAWLSTRVAGIPLERHGHELGLVLAGRAARRRACPRRSRRRPVRTAPVARTRRFSRACLQLGLEGGDARCRGRRSGAAWRR